VNLDIGSHTKRAKLATTQSRVEVEAWVQASSAYGGSFVRIIMKTDKVKVINVLKKLEYSNKNIIFFI
jgi:hypothetical protein